MYSDYEGRMWKVRIHFLNRRKSQEEKYNTMRKIKSWYHLTTSSVLLRFFSMKALIIEGNLSKLSKTKHIQLKKDSIDVCGYWSYGGENHCKVSKEGMTCESLLFSKYEWSERNILKNEISWAWGVIASIYHSLKKYSPHVLYAN